jgi:hypothetical protein
MGDSGSAAKGRSRNEKMEEKAKKRWVNGGTHATNEGMSKTTWSNVNLYRSYRKFSINKLLNPKMGKKENNNGKVTVRTVTEAT